MSVKVSVVVPVFNPGHYIDDCLASAVTQSLPATEYEVIFVDDGSTDGTGAHLDALAARNGNVRAIHLRRTGSPSGPRNTGLRHARGEYVFFLDDDDWLERTALEHLHRYASRHQADVVVGRTVGHQGKAVPNVLFRRNRPRISLSTHSGLLLLLLTPHKLFRKAFLDKHGIRFPEGQSRLEDHHFCLQAYFRTDRVAVLANRICYHWRGRDERSKLHAIRADPAEYYQSLRAVLDLVERHTEPGPRREGLLAHWYSRKVLAHLGAIGEPDGAHPALFEETQKVAQERFPPSVDDHLSPTKRGLSLLLRAGARELSAAFARTESGIHLPIRVAASDAAAGEVALTLAGTLCYADGTPVRFQRLGDRVFWQLPVPFDQPTPIPAGAVDVTDALPRSRLDVLLTSRRTGGTRFVPVTYALHETGTTQCDTFVLDVSGTARLHSAAGENARAELGDHDVSARFSCCGWVSYHPLEAALRIVETPGAASAPHARLC